MPLIQLNNVNKKFKQKQVLQKVTFSINENEIIGIIGPNGSGKTTLLNLIMRLIKPDSGTIVHSTTSDINAAVSRKGFFDGMSVYNNLKVSAYLKKQPNSEIDRVLELFDIDFASMNYNKLSAGMKQRVSLAQAFMGNYRLVLLDEPTNHLDIDSLIKLRAAVESKKENGTSFIIASHVLTELERQCDRALFLIGGILKKEVILNSQVQTDLEKEYLLMSNI